MSGNAQCFHVDHSILFTMSKSKNISFWMVLEDGEIGCWCFHMDFTALWVQKLLDCLRKIVTWSSYFEGNNGKSFIFGETSKQTKPQAKYLISTKYALISGLIFCDPMDL